MITHRTHPVDGHAIEVELTPEEAEANNRWNELLGDGLGIGEATDKVEAEFPGLDPTFYEYLRR